MKKFLTSFAALAAGFATQNAIAAQVVVEQSTTTEASAAALATPSENLSIKNASGDEFNFVLKRSADTGTLMAYHRSHSSHSSHSSHYSSRR